MTFALKGPQQVSPGQSAATKRRHGEQVTASLASKALSVCRIEHWRKGCRKHWEPGVHVARRDELELRDEEQNWRKALPLPRPNFLQPRIRPSVGSGT